MAVCLVSLGSNLGDRAQTLDAAVAALQPYPDIHVVAWSRWRETAPVGGPSGQGAFLNGALRLETPLRPLALQAVLQNVEQQLGRWRGERWAARTLDLDLLLYDDIVLQTEDLTLPHPRMAFRRFVLEPAAEVGGDLLHPTIQWTIAALLAHLNAAAEYLAIAGPIGAGKTELAGELARRTSGRLIQEPLDPDQLRAFYADPSGQAWATEIRFLDLRRQLLTRASWPDPDQLTVSDFWFDQSLAFAEVWLNGEQFQRFTDIWQSAQPTITRPKLLVWLDAPLQELRRRIVGRGRPYEQELSEDKLASLRAALIKQAARPGIGPVLRLPKRDRQQTLQEVMAAVAAMR